MTPGLLIAQGFNIDLGSPAFVPPASYSAASGQAGTWNNLETGTTPNILDTGGTASGVSVTVTADGNGSASGCVGDNQPLMSDNVFTTQGGWSMVFTGLPAADYQVYIYAPNHDGVATGNMLVNGIAVASLSGTVDCSLQPTVSYVSVRASVSSGTLTLSGDYSGTGFDYAGVAGVQICESIFADGFESGDTTLWSSTVP
jgi:hypothetical protein